KQFNALQGVATSSGTTALQLALISLGVGVGDEVLVPSYTCVAVAHAVRMLGAIPVLFDNLFIPERMDFNPDPESARTRISKHSKALIAPHTFGICADIAPFVALGLPIIEDCAMALGASGMKRSNASRGQIAITSFHASKMISTGVGGMAFALSDFNAEMIRESNSSTESQISDRTAKENEVFGNYRLQTNYEMTDIAAALGLNQLRRLPRFIKRRREIAEMFNGMLSNASVYTPSAVSEESIYFRYIIDISKSGRSVEDVVFEFGKYEIEIGRGVYPALHQLMGEYGWESSNAKKCIERLVSLPVHPGLTDSQAERVGQVAATVFG
ncbi:MAG TPA: DegT/DnrJ/EryC1/StrS family aminotransferase, partial [Acidimicrobiales bacterium]|nr:DegT/DnrJ/EryC1/StrS family aminotransferase [Acidimicrobiales bacterium]